jgi:hypothetical protein
VDVFFQANIRNAAMLKKHLQQKGAAVLKAKGHMV